MIVRTYVASPKKEDENSGKKKKEKSPIQIIKQEEKIDDVK